MGFSLVLFRMLKLFAFFFNKKRRKREDREQQFRMKIEIIGSLSALCMHVDKKGVERRVKHVA